MDNVIQFPVRPLSFLQQVENQLCEDDYLDFLEGINSKEIYDNLDSDIQQLIDNYIMSGM
jgi:hypothetical protein